MRLRTILIILAALVVVTCAESSGPNSTEGCYVPAGLHLLYPDDIELCQQLYNQLYPAVFKKKGGRVEEVIRHFNGSTYGLIWHERSQADPEALRNYLNNGIPIVISIAGPKLNHTLVVVDFEYDDGWGDKMTCLETIDASYTPVEFTITINNGWWVDNGKYAGYSFNGFYSYHAQWVEKVNKFTG